MQVLVEARWYEIEEAWSYNLTPRLRREVRKIIFDHFDLIVGEWERSLGSKGDAGDHRSLQLELS